jgi:indole-3-glycerol phosphate synthase
MVVLCIVLTDEYFCGSLDDLLLSGLGNIPLLRKEFVWMNPEAEAYGADLILFIAVLIVKKSNHFLSLLKF